MRRFALGVWEFVVGDDPLLAVGVIVALALTALASAWWLMPVAVVLLLCASLLRAAR
jgi:hypothetical protein